MEEFSACTLTAGDDLTALGLAAQALSTNNAASVMARANAPHLPRPCCLCWLCLLCLLCELCPLWLIDPHRTPLMIAHDLQRQILLMVPRRKHPTRYETPGKAQRLRRFPANVSNLTYFPHIFTILTNPLQSPPARLDVRRECQCHTLATNWPGICSIGFSRVSRCDRT